MTLLKALPHLVHAICAALLQIGRGDIVDQLREAELERWTYDDFADAAYLYVRPPGPREAGPAEAEPAEIVAALDDANIELDSRRRVVRIEVLGASSLVAELERGSAG